MSRERKHAHERKVTNLPSMRGSVAIRPAKGCGPLGGFDECSAFGTHCRALSPRQRGRAARFNSLHAAGELFVRRSDRTGCAKFKKADATCFRRSMAVVSKIQRRAAIRLLNYPRHEERSNSDALHRVRQSSYQGQQRCHLRPLTDISNGGGVRMRGDLRLRHLNSRIETPRTTGQQGRTL